MKLLQAGRAVGVLAAQGFVAVLTLSVCSAPPLSIRPARADEAKAERRASTTDIRLSPERARHLALLGVDQWHKAATRGRGVKVAILDTGFRGYRGFLGTALPATVTARSFRKDARLEARDSQHGILCGEIVHSVAPDAELLLANWEQDDAESFLKAVQWAHDEAARI